MKPSHLLKTVLFVFTIFLFSNGYSQPTAQPVKIIFDCDFGDDGDDLAALLMLHHTQDNNECEIIAIGQCNSTPGALAAMDIINTWYGRPDIPLGQIQSKTHEGDQYISFLIDNYPELTDVDKNYSPNAVDVYRKALANAPDHSVNFIVVGLKKNMADLLQSSPDEHSPLSGRDLVAQKGKAVYDMGGAYPASTAPEFNFNLEPAATQYYVENCPVPIMFAGSAFGGIHVGQELRKLNTPAGRAMDHKLAGTGGLYWHGKRVEEYQAAFDCAAALAAVRGENNYYNLVAGCNHIDDKGGNSFKREGCFRHVYFDSENLKTSYKDIADEIEAMITAAPLKSGCAAKRHPVIFDTDANNELDDQHAIAYLLFNQDIFQVKGITTNRTYNGGSIADHTAEAERVVKMCNSWGQFPVLSGADGTFEEIKPHLDEPDFDGHAAVNFIIQQAHEPGSGKLLLLPVGKITNIALALEKDPTIIPKVKVVWMGTQAPYRNPEYNQGNDIGAAQAVLATDVELWLCPADGATGDVGASQSEIKNNMPGKGPRVNPAVLGRDGERYNYFGDYSVSLFKNVSHSWRSLYDMAAVATVKNPAWAKKTTVTGAFLNDDGSWSYKAGTREITWFRDYDLDAVMADFWDSMNNPVLAAEADRLKKKTATDVHQ